MTSGKAEGERKVVSEEKERESEGGGKGSKEGRIEVKGR